MRASGPLQGAQRFACETKRLGERRSHSGYGGEEFVKIALIEIAIASTSRFKAWVANLINHTMKSNGLRVREQGAESRNS